MNRAIAVAELDGPEAGLAPLDSLELDDYRYLAWIKRHATSVSFARSNGGANAAHPASGTAGTWCLRRPMLHVQRLISPPG
jgi:RNA polymerase sigma-70 factor, ECF subfamily